MTTRTEKVAKSAEAVVVSYKGFDANMRCRGFQYEVGKTYVHDGEAVTCSSGFHACQHPLSVWGYYGVNNGNRFAVVEQSGQMSADGDKTASQKITIKAEIGIPGFVKAAVEWTRSKAADATSGDCAHSATSGNSAHSATSGDCANSATSGYCAHSATSGYCAHSATSGDYAHSATSGDYAHSATSGDYAHSATSGDCAHSATSGNYAHSATSGNYAHSATSGDYAHSATSGDCANSATSGYSARSSTKGSDAVAANAGNGPAMAGDGGAIFIVERDYNLRIIAVFASLVGQNGIKADTWYALKDGKPVEVAA
jgi:hypothetical protein